MSKQIERIVAGLRSPSLMKPPTAYAYWLVRATRALGHAEFGDWRGFNEIPNINPTQPSIPERNFAKDKFDKIFWQSISVEAAKAYGYSEALAPHGGHSAAAAVDAIVAHPERWRMDCDHTVQIANLYATMQTLGVDAFNARVDAQMWLLPRYSSGLVTKLHYARNVYDASAPKPWRWRAVNHYLPGAKNYDPQKGEPVPADFEFEPGNLGDVTVEELLRKTPPGSRVRWTNVVQPLDDPFRHENTVKLQDDLYAAGGLAAPLTGNEYDRKNLESLMVTIPGRLYIDEIEVFELHG